MYHQPGILPAGQGRHLGQASGGGDREKAGEDSGAGADPLVPAERSDDHSKIDQEDESQGEHGGEQQIRQDAP